MRSRSLRTNNDDYKKLKWGRNKHVGMCFVDEFFQPMPFFYTREGNVLPLTGHFRGWACFIICGGPSLAKIDHTKFSTPGIMTMTINNAVKLVRSNMWICVDEPTHFLTSVWLDPKIMKFVPFDHTDKPLWDVRNGAWKPLHVGEKQIVVGDCPNMVYYRRNCKFNEERYLWEDTINWGDTEKFGGARSVLLAAVRIVFLLGFRRLYLVGVDFDTTADTHYAFKQKKDEGAVKSNQVTYDKLVERFTLLQPYFEESNFNIMNCNCNSGLKIFPFVELEEAIKKEASIVGDTTQEETEGLYDSVYDEKVVQMCRQMSTGSKEPGAQCD